jgi:type II secretory pathway pseudopilin PulG
VKTRATDTRSAGLISPLRREVTVAFSLIEVLVVVALLSFIIIGLVTMFSQTQRAYKLGTAQVDVLEAGRAVTDMMTREFSQMSPAYQPNFGLAGAINFRTSLHFSRLWQELPGNPAPGRLNLLQDVFFLTKENHRWKGIGYLIFDPATGGPPGGGVGTLYRFETNAYVGQPLWQLHAAYTNAWHTNANVTRLLDGVVHFKVRGYETNGVWIGQAAAGTNNNNIGIDYLFLPDEPSGTFFYSNAVPGSVEIELGILEERALERARSIGDANTRSNFLAQQAGKVHVFRWRVPVRNVDPLAYQ